MNVQVKMKVILLQKDDVWKEKGGREGGVSIILLKSRFSMVISQNKKMLVSNMQLWHMQTNKS